MGFKKGLTQNLWKTNLQPEIDALLDILKFGTDAYMCVPRQFFFGGG